MGVGAVFAGGCNVGQGLTGISSVSIHSFIAVAGILIGMLSNLWLLQRLPKTDTGYEAGLLSPAISDSRENSHAAYTTHLVPHRFITLAIGGYTGRCF